MKISSDLRRSHQIWEDIITLLVNLEHPHEFGFLELSHVSGHRLKFFHGQVRVVDLAGNMASLLQPDYSLEEVDLIELLQPAVFDHDGVFSWRSKCRIDVDVLFELTIISMCVP